MKQEIKDEVSESQWKTIEKAFEKRKPIRTKSFFEFELDFNFWALIPAININLHTNTFEIEWLCFALYIGK